MISPCLCMFKTIFLIKINFWPNKYMYKSLVLLRLSHSFMIIFFSFDKWIVLNLIALFSSHCIHRQSMYRLSNLPISWAKNKIMFFRFFWPARINMLLFGDNIQGLSKKKMMTTDNQIWQNNTWTLLTNYFPSEIQVTQMCKISEIHAIQFASLFFISFLVF